MIKQALYLLPLMLLCTGVQAFNVNALGNSDDDSLYDSRSCNELYMQVSALEKTSHSNKESHFTNSKAQVASMAMTVFTPAIYYFGYAAYKDLESNMRSMAALEQMDEIRYRMAEKRCFDR